MGTKLNSFLQWFFQLTEVTERSEEELIRWLKPTMVIFCFRKSVWSRKMGSKLPYVQRSSMCSENGLQKIDLRVFRRRACKKSGTLVVCRWEVSSLKFGLRWSTVEERVKLNNTCWRRVSTSSATRRNDHPLEVMARKVSATFLQQNFVAAKVLWKKFSEKLYGN